MRLHAGELRPMPMVLSLTGSRIDLDGDDLSAVVADDKM